MPRPSDPSTLPGASPSSTGPAPADRAAPRRVARAAPPRPLLPPASMVDLGPAGVRLGVPAVELRPVFSAHEVRQYGMAQRDEVRVPVFRATF
ncbi:MAG TPA: hypothetical protein VFS00_19755 [Polyangiaceae bacterium]|nr:hypothetical protein [Polyangiaceae bacterium]